MKFVLNKQHFPRHIKDHWRDMLLAVAIRFDVIWYARNQVSHGKELPTPTMMINDGVVIPLTNERGCLFSGKRRCFGRPLTLANLKSTKMLQY